MAVAPAAGKVFLNVVGAFVASSVIVRTILVNVLLGALSKALSNEPRQYIPPINVTVRNTVENRRLCFGSVRCGGVVAFYRASGNSNEFLHFVIVFTGHQISGIKTIWIDKQPIEVADWDAGTGAVTSGPFAGVVSIWKYLGTSAQTVDPTLTAARSEWDSTHRLQGCAYIHIRMLRNDAAFPQGAPQDITAHIDGALCYDPRLDSTNGGSGSHRAADPSTWAFTRNPALHTRWFLTGGSVVNDVASRQIMYGLREDNSRILDAYTIAAANKCEEQLTGAYSTPDGDQQRYACDLEVSTGEPRRDVLEALLATMAGRAISIQGKWRIYAGAYDSPTHTLTDADLYGDTPIEVEDTTSHTERYNAVAAVFRDASNSYSEQTTAFRTNSSYESQDGSERIAVEIDLRGVTDKYRAQRLCEIHLRKSRQMRIIKLRGALNLLKVAPHETFSLSHSRLGWSGSVFRCLEREFEFLEDAGRVTITAQAEAASVYADLLTAEYITPNSIIPIQQAEIPDAPTNLQAIPQSNGILVKWTRSATPSVNYQLEQSTSSSMSSPTIVYDGADNQAYIDQTGTTVFYYRVRAYKSGQYSAYLPSTGGTSGAASGVSTTLTASASTGSLSSSSTSSSQTTGTVTITPAGGSSPYTYAWTWLTGGAGITITSASSASTTFSAATLGNPETRTGVARCTVTDSAAASRTVDVSVSIERTYLFSATASGTNVYKTANSNTITSNPITATPSGGVAPYTYAWSIVFHNDPNSTPTINNPTSQSCTVTTNDSPLAQRTINVSVQCVVTDNTSVTATTNTVSISHTHDNGV